MVAFIFKIYFQIASQWVFASWYEPTESPQGVWTLITESLTVYIYKSII